MLTLITVLGFMQCRAVLFKAAFQQKIKIRCAGTRTLNCQTPDPYHVLREMSGFQVEAYFDLLNHEVRVILARH